MRVVIRKLSYFAILSGIISLNTSCTGQNTQEGLPEELAGLYVNHISGVEGDADTVDFEFIATLDKPVQKEITFDYETVDGTAISGEDYVAKSGKEIVIPGQTEVIIAIKVNGDTNVEQDEKFYLEVSNLTGVDLDEETEDSIRLEATIINDDVFPSISFGDVSYEEGDAGTVDFEFVLRLNKPAQEEVTFDYQTINHTAISGEDYVAKSGKGIVISGQSEVTIVVKVNGDTDVEPDERFYLEVSNLTGVDLSGATGDSFRLRANITNDDFIPSISIEDVSYEEGDSGTIDAQFIVSLDRVVKEGQSVNFTYRTNHISTDNEDYSMVANATLVTISPTKDNAEINISINGDTEIENDETFELILENITGTTLSVDNNTLSATGTIRDNDSAAGNVSLDIRIADVSKIEQDSGTTEFRFTASLNKLSSTSVTFNYKTIHVSTDDSDYQTVKTAVAAVILAGEYLLDISIMVNGDEEPESTETFKLQLENIVGITNVTSVFATGSIIDDDPDADGDGLGDDLDECDNSPSGWTRDDTSDVDVDGCRDSDEDDFPSDSNRNATDLDGNGLINITSEDMLRNIKYNLAGSSYKTSVSDRARTRGCPSDTCNGYEMDNSIDITSNFDPLGSGTEAFTGIFDGNGKSINYLDISVSNLEYVGLFANIGNSDATDPKGLVRNLNLNNVTVTRSNVTIITTDYKFLGVLAGNVESEGQIEAITVTNATLTTGAGFDSVGGLVGYNKGSMEGIYVSVIINNGLNRTYTGGVAGHNTGTINEAYASGKINGNNGQDLTGGIAGYNSGTIRYGSAQVNQTGAQHFDKIGGLVGENEGGNIYNSYATGTIDSGVHSDFTGGLVGECTNGGSIRNSFVPAGTVSGGRDVDFVGGLVGKFLECNVYNSYAAVAVSGNGGNDSVGGLIGQSSNSGIYNSYSMGDVSGNDGDDEMGGLVGSKNSTTIISNSYYSTDITLDNGSGDALRGISEGKTDAVLRSPTAASGIYSSWDIKNWEFGSSSQYPTLRDYRKENDSQVQGDILCNQPNQGTDRVQCLNP